LIDYAFPITSEKYHTGKQVAEECKLTRCICSIINILKNPELEGWAV